MNEAERERVIKEIRSEINENDSYPKFTKQIKKWSPHTFAAFFGRRYILPHYRVEHYFRQQFLDYIEWANLQYYPLGDPKDEIMRTSFVCTSMALRHKRPTLFLERELGEPLIRTSPPLDMEAQEIKWKWPAFRIFLPKGLLTIKRENYDHSLMYLDIALMEGSSWHRIPEIFAAEMDLYLAKMHPKEMQLVKILLDEFRFQYPDTAILCSGMIEKGPANIGLVTYGMVKPFTKYTLRYLTEMSNELKSDWKRDPLDDVFIHRMELLALNILLFLSAYPLEYKPDEAAVIRKPRLEGKEHLPGLYPAKFVGQSQIRPESKHHHIAGVMSHEEYHQKLHWRCGAWRRQHFGPKWSETKLVWINPYQAGREAEEEEERNAKKKM